ncbi:MAG: Rieske (2Fe-2S) protein [Armatimonadetes bacterium]|nr:Rieske (2Fe-2S) protein [Armatimonadota bacterium]
MTEPRPTTREYPAASLTELRSRGRLLVELEGHSIGLFCVRDEIIAVLNVCPHELAPVCRGRVGGTTLPSPPGEFCWGREGEILACPWHGWEFDLLTGEALTDPRKRLRRYPIRVEGDQVLVRL